MRRTWANRLLFGSLVAILGLLVAANVTMLGAARIGEAIRGPVEPTGVFFGLALIAILVAMSRRRWLHFQCLPPFADDRGRTRTEGVAASRG